MKRSGSGMLAGVGAAVLIAALPAWAQEDGGGRGAGRRGRGGANVQAQQAAFAGEPKLPDGPVKPTWESIREHYKTPAWFTEGKFGIFMHWGLYAVPANGSEWYVRHMYNPGAIMQSQIQRFGPLDTFGYKDFIPKFTCEHYDPDAWVALFKKAGARYIMPTAEHHDGFALWDSALTKWDAKDMGPKRDLIGDMAVAARKAGLKFGVSNHRYEHFDFIQEPQGVPTDLRDPAAAGFYWVAEREEPGAYQKFLQDWVARNFELIDKYQPDMIFFDNGLNGREHDPVKLKVAAYYYNRAKEWGKEVSLTTKQQAYLAGTVLDLERGRTVDIHNEPWQEDTSMGHNSWGYADNLVLRNAGEMVRELVDCVSKNGNYLLNIGPKADGTIPDDQALRLLEIGSWLRQNGEAIYGTRAWTRFGEGPTPQGAPNGTRGLTDGMLKVYTAQDMRFTVKGNDLFVIGFAWPADGKVTVTSLAADKVGKITAVSTLGSSQRTTFTQDAEGLKITFPVWKTNDYAWAIKVTGALKSE